jgi:type VI secretion system secreted protein VgrG
MALEQDQRICQLAPSSGFDEFVVRRFRGREAISEPFRFDLELVAPDFAVDLDRLLGANLTFTVTLPNGVARPFHGLVAHVQQTAVELAGAIYQLRLVPWTRLLDLQTNCRVFQEMAVPDIVERVFGDHGALDFELRLEAEYQQRVLCVQYRESDWAFVTRLLEEEGIAYHFEHEDGRHVLVLCDSPGRRQACPEQATALFRTAQDSGQQDDGMLQDVVQEFRLERSLLTGRRLLTDFNYLDPGANLEAVGKAALSVDVNRDLEDFEYPGGFVKLGAEGDAKLPFGEKLAAVRAEALDARALRALGETNCRGLQSGCTFELLNHPRQDCSIAWLILSVDHDLDQAAALSTSAAGAPYYVNTIECLSAKIPFRPTRLTQRPVVKGPQTAIVTGPAGEEIHTDKYGRVKVAFHWDRYGARDGSDSCWVRVAHGWAGGGWGMQFTPRIGQEVVVEFLEGDPDRPLITGSVYNGKNAIPFKPATQSGIRTRSSKEGGASNCNEIRFEDKKGSEDFFVQAERTQTIIVKASQTSTIGADQSLSVGANRSVSVESNETKAVSKNQDITVANNRSLTVSKNLTESIGGSRSTSVAKDASLDVGGARSTSVGKDDSLAVTGNYTADVAKDGVLKTGKNLVLEAADAITIKVGKASVTLKKDGTVTIDGKDLTMKGSGKINVKASSDVTIKGSKVQSN